MKSVNLTDYEKHAIVFRGSRTLIRPARSEDETITVLLEVIGRADIRLKVGMAYKCRLRDIREVDLMEAGFSRDDFECHWMVNFGEFDELRLVWNITFALVSCG